MPLKREFLSPEIIRNGIVTVAIPYGTQAETTQTGNGSARVSRVVFNRTEDALCMRSAKPMFLRQAKDTRHLHTDLPYWDRAGRISQNGRVDVDVYMKSILLVHPVCPYEKGKLCG